MIEATVNVEELLKQWLVDNYKKQGQELTKFKVTEYTIEDMITTRYPANVKINVSFTFDTKESESK